MAVGFSQKEGINCEENFAPTTRYTTIRSHISLASTMGWNIHQMDGKTTFLNGTIDEEVYIEQHHRFKVHDKEKHVCILKKALYSLKQAPREWYTRMDAYLLILGFVKSFANPNLYIKVVKNEHVIILLYVDDLQVIGIEHHIQGCKKQQAIVFDMKDIGLMHNYLGLEVWKKPSEIYLG